MRWRRTLRRALQSPYQGMSHEKSHLLQPDQPGFARFAYRLWPELPRERWLSNNTQPASPYGQAEPYGTAPGNSCDRNQPPASYPADTQLRTADNGNTVPKASASVPVGPSVRITVVSANSTDSSRSVAKLPAANLTIVSDDAPASKTEEIATSEPVLDEIVAKLVGTWKAVARHDDGELTTVELHLDNHGWAEVDDSRQQRQAFHDQEPHQVGK